MTEDTSLLRFQWMRFLLLNSFLLQLLTFSDLYQVSSSTLSGRVQRVRKVEYQIFSEDKENGLKKIVQIQCCGTKYHFQSPMFSVYFYTLSAMDNRMQTSTIPHLVRLAKVIPHKERVSSAIVVVNTQPINRHRNGAGSAQAEEKATS